MNGVALDEAIVQEAAQWMAVLQSGHASPEEYQAFRQWRNGDPRRDEVFSTMGAGLGVLQGEKLRHLHRDDLLHTLNAPSGRRRFMRNVLSVAGAMSTLALVARATHTWPLPGVISTGTGERLSVSLDDGSALMLDARSKVRQGFTVTQRVVELLDGQVWVNVAKDSQRPFIIQTAQGQMRALGTRFVAAQGEGLTHLSMLHSQVEIKTRRGSTQVIEAGQRARFDADRILAVENATGGEVAWMQGMLEVRDQPLSEVVEALRNYRRGIIRLSPAVSALRLSGLFPLDDTDRTLQLLARSLPVRVDYHSPYWVTIERR